MTSTSTAKALLGVVRDPVPVARRVGGLVRELGAVVAGSSEVAPAHLVGAAVPAHRAGLV